MPTHYVVRTTSAEDTVNATIKENEAKGAGLIQVLPIVAEHSTTEVLLVFRLADDSSRPAGFRFGTDAER